MPVKHLSDARRLIAALFVAASAVWLHAQVAS
jgi:hypothetical protein